MSNLTKVSVVIIFLNEERFIEEAIESVLVASDKTLLKYARPSGEARFPTAAHIVTAQKGLADE